MRSPRCLLRVSLLLPILVLCLASCRSTNQLLKAKPVGLSPFIERPQWMRDNREHVPFHLLWMTSDPPARARAGQKSEIYIAPVTLRYLRPLKKTLVRKEVAAGSIDRRETEMARLLRGEFAHAFAEVPPSRYYVTSQPNGRSVTLELALVELNPTSPKGNAVKTAAKFFVGPLAGLGGMFTKGNVAIEGKVRNSITGELICEFADNEADRMTLYTLRDFRPYGHAEYAMRSWAEQFERLTRAPSGENIGDTAFFTLDPR
ncbi:MAG TPA: DUF3313 family protein [Candidatus Saccharimonadia bacterium]|nr:DUF3313 family protein [Candidatus Saccharimonadia bacterium]